MGLDGNGNGEQHDAKRQRLGNNTNEQRSAFAEDMARVRSAMNGDGTGVPLAAPSGVSGGEAAGDGQQQQRQQHQQSGASALHQQQQSGESSLQQPARQYLLQPPQQRQAPSIAAPGNNDQRPTGGSESEDEEDGGGNWLKNYTPHHTRVGDNYQVANLPSAPAHVAAAPAAVPGSWISPGGSGEG